MAIHESPKSGISFSIHIELLKAAYDVFQIFDHSSLALFSLWPRVTFDVKAGLITATDETSRPSSKRVVDCLQLLNHCPSRPSSYKSPDKSLVDNLQSSPAYPDLKVSSHMSMSSHIVRTN